MSGRGYAELMEHIVVPELAEFESQWHFSHAVRSRGLVLMSGVTGVAPSGEFSTDPTVQFRQAFEHLRQYLGAAGLGFGHLIEITTYHVGLREHLAAFMTVKDEYVQAPYPAWSAIGVNELITSGALVEIRGIAEGPA
jgi:enamine deaminase RidA (YjgF/YER057c/UK114 family)